MPPREILWLTLLAFRLLSFQLNAAWRGPVACGLKLTGREQADPGASPEASVSFEFEHTALPSVKLTVETAGYAEKVNGMLPLLATVTVCGLSLLVAPSAVAAKSNDGGVARVISSTTPLLALPTKILPLLSTAMPMGVLKPVATEKGVLVPAEIS